LPAAFALRLFTTAGSTRLFETSTMIRILR